MARTAIMHGITPTAKTWETAQRIARKLGISVTKLFTRLIEEYESKELAK